MSISEKLFSVLRKPSCQKVKQATILVDSFCKRRRFDLLLADSVQYLAKSLRGIHSSYS